MSIQGQNILAQFLISFINEKNNRERAFFRGETENIFEDNQNENVKFLGSKMQIYWSQIVKKDC